MTFRRLTSNISTSTLVVGLLTSLIVSAACGSYEAERAGVINRDAPDPAQHDVEAEWILSVVDANTYSVPKGETATIRVQLAHPEKGVQSGEAVEFELVDAENADSKLAARQSETNQDGIADVEFRAGRTLATHTVRADHPKADPVKVHVDVTEPPAGKLHVTFDQPKAQATKLETTRAKLYPSDQFSCSNYDPLANHKAAPKNKQVATPDEPVTFEELDAEKTYTVVARSQNQGGLPAAAGCRDAIDVPSGDTANTTVELTYLPLDPAGRYDIRSRWDMTSFASNASPFGERIQTILDAVADPAGALFDRLAKELEKRTNDLVAYVVKNSSVAANIQRAINDQLSRTGLPDKVRHVASSLQNTMKRLEIEGELVISRRGEDATVTGRHIWKTAYVQPPSNCTSNAPACQKQKIPLQSEKPNGLNATFEGRVEDYNTLVLDKHDIRVDIGDLTTKILERVLIPQMTDGAANTFEGAINHWFDCSGLARDLAANGTLCISDVCVPENTVRSACQATVSTVFNVEKLADRLFDMNVTFEIEGTAEMTERNAQDKVVRLEDGSFQGRIRLIGNQTSSPADATWTAERQ